MKINLHAHSHNSDGVGTLLTLAKKAKEFGHCALVVTDHDSNYTSAFHRNVSELETMEHLGIELPIPIIIGSEINTPFGEMLLFGRKALEYWDRHKDQLDYVKAVFGVNTWVTLFREEILSKSMYNIVRGESFKTGVKPLDYALIVAHPRFSADWVEEHWTQEWCDLLHGFEIQNGKRKFDSTPKTDTNWCGGGPLTVAALRNRIGPCGEFRNSDAHRPVDLQDCHNNLDIEIKNEKELIDWIVSKRRRKE